MVSSHLVLSGFLFTLIFSSSLATVEEEVWWAELCGLSSCLLSDTLIRDEPNCHIHVAPLGILTDSQSSKANRLISSLIDANALIDNLKTRLSQFIDNYQSERGVSNSISYVSNCYSYGKGKKPFPYSDPSRQFADALRNITRSAFVHLIEAMHHLNQIESYEDQNEYPPLTRQLTTLQADYGSVYCQLHRIHNALSVKHPAEGNECHAWKCFLKSMQPPGDHCLRAGDRAMARLNHVALLKESEQQLDTIVHDLTSASNQMRSDVVGKRAALSRYFRHVL